MIYVDLTDASWSEATVMQVDWAVSSSFAK